VSRWWWIPRALGSQASSTEPSPILASRCVSLSRARARARSLSLSLSLSFSLSVSISRSFPRARALSPSLPPSLVCMCVCVRARGCVSQFSLSLHHACALACARALFLPSLRVWRALSGMHAHLVRVRRRVLQGERERARVGAQAGMHANSEAFKQKVGGCACSRRMRV